MYLLNMTLILLKSLLMKVTQQPVRYLTALEEGGVNALLEDILKLVLLFTD